MNVFILCDLVNLFMYIEVRPRVELHVQRFTALLIIDSWVHWLASFSPLRLSLRILTMLLSQPKV